MSLCVQSISLVSVAQDTRSSLDQNKTDPAGKALVVADTLLPRYQLC